MVNLLVGAIAVRKSDRSCTSVSCFGCTSFLSRSVSYQARKERGQNRYHLPRCVIIAMSHLLLYFVTSIVVVAKGKGRWILTHIFHVVKPETRSMDS